MRTIGMSHLFVFLLLALLLLSSLPSSSCVRRPRDYSSLLEAAEEEELRRIQEEESKIVKKSSPEYARGQFILQNPESIAIIEYHLLSSSSLPPLHRPIASVDITQIIVQDPFTAHRLRAARKRVRESKSIPARLEEDPATGRLKESLEIHDLSRCRLLDLAALKGYKILVKILLDKGAHTNTSDCTMKSLMTVNSLTPLHLAALFSHTEPFHREPPKGQGINDAQRRIALDRTIDEIIGAATIDERTRDSIATMNILLSHGVAALALSGPSSESALTFLADRGNYYGFLNMLSKSTPPQYFNDSVWRPIGNASSPSSPPSPSPASSEPAANATAAVDAYEVLKDGRRRPLKRVVTDSVYESILQSNRANSTVELNIALYEGHPALRYRIAPSLLLFRHQLHKAFLYAVMNGSYEIVEYLLHHRALYRLDLNIHSNDGKGDTALHGCCLTDNGLLMSLLLEAGADPMTTTGNEGETVEQLCKRHGSKFASLVLNDYLQKQAEKAKDKTAAKKEQEAPTRGTPKNDEL